MYFVYFTAHVVSHIWKQSQSCKKLNRSVIYLFASFWPFWCHFFLQALQLKTNNKIPSICLFHFFFNLLNCFKLFEMFLLSLKDNKRILLLSFCVVYKSRVTGIEWVTCFVKCMLCRDAFIEQWLLSSLTLWQDKHLADVGTHCSLLFILNWKFLPRNVTETSELINSSINLSQIMFCTVKLLHTKRPLQRPLDISLQNRSPAFSD